MRHHGPIMPRKAAGSRVNIGRTRRRDEQRGLWTYRGIRMLDVIMADDAGNVAKRFCLDCGYPLDHLDQTRCPECGRTFDPTKPATYAASPRVVRRWPAALAWSTAVLPMFLLVSFYGTWAATWLYLGHPPRAYIDDVIYPQLGDVAVWLGIAGYVFGFVPSLLCVLATDIYYLYRQRPRIVVASSIIVLLWALPYLMIVWDPFGAWNWFID